MKALLVRYKLVVRFIVVFFIVYGSLSVSYILYLNTSFSKENYPDYITNLVAQQTNVLLNSVGYTASVVAHQDEPSLKIIINGKFVARVVEGCNAISVIVLFLSFIIAFSGRFKTTFLYGLAGSVIIYVFNITRIAVLSAGLYHYPWRRDILHNVIFPMIIYGTVFLLWMIWVNRFSKSNSKYD